MIVCIVLGWDTGQKEKKKEKIQFCFANEVVILSRDRVLCPVIFAPVFVPGQRDKVTRFVFVLGQRDNGTSLPSLSQDVSGLSGPVGNPSQKVL